jgi:hypothetical protein
MIINNINRGLEGIAFFLFLITMPSRIHAAENPHLDNISRALGASALPRIEQNDVKAGAAAAVGAGLPAEDVEIVVTRSLNRGTDAGTISRFLATSVSAKKEGLPVGPVLDRIEQGLSKGVPAVQIAEASERLTEKLRTARPLVDKLIRDGLRPGRNAERDEAMVSTARALEKSIPEETIKGIGAAAWGRRGSLQLFTRAVDTASYFTVRGMSAQTASNLVQNAVEKGYNEKHLDSMVRRLDTEMKKGTRAEDAAAKMDREDMRDARGLGREDMRQDMKTDRSRGAGSGMGGRGR